MVFIRRRVRQRAAQRAALNRPDLTPYLERRPADHTSVSADTERSVPAAPRVCDPSGDAGTTHVWPPGAQVGDWCRCGKRRRFTP
jgi:hypothetical protein